MKIALEQLKTDADEIAVWKKAEILWKNNSVFFSDWKVAERDVTERAQTTSLLRFNDRWSNKSNERRFGTAVKKASSLWSFIENYFSFFKFGLSKTTNRRRFVSSSGELFRERLVDPRTNSGRNPTLWNFSASSKLKWKKSVLHSIDVSFF